MEVLRGWRPPRNSPLPSRAPSIEPDRDAKHQPSPRAAANRSPGPAGETFIVSREDFRKYGRDVGKLRQHGRVLSREEQVEGPKQDLSMSYRSVFRRKCTSEETPRDPWLDMVNPELHRPINDRDLVINQVWVGRVPPQPLKMSQLPLPRLPPLDPATPRGGLSSRTMLSGRAASAEPLARRRARSSSSSRHLRPEPSKHRPASSRSDRLKPGSARSSSKNSPAAGSGIPKPVSVSRIRLISDSEEFTDAELAEQEKSKPQRTVGEWRNQGSSSKPPPVLWVVVDPSSGEAHAFPRAAGARLESAHLAGRSSIPLAGLDEPSLESSIVCLAKSLPGEGYVERRADEVRDVRRVTVPESGVDVVVHVRNAGDEAEADDWRIADEPVPGETEERRVNIAYTNIVYPESPKPLVVKDRSRFYMNTVQHPTG